MTGDVFIRHYTAVADASPVPVLLYNFAAAFGVNLPTDAVVALAPHPNIIGMKESGGDLAQIGDQVSRDARRLRRGRRAAPMLYASLCVGAIGGFVAAANVIPEPLVRLYDLATSGRHARGTGAAARDRAARARRDGRLGRAGVKAAMTLAGYRGGYPRAPLAPRARPPSSNACAA